MARLPLPRNRQHGRSAARTAVALLAAGALLAVAHPAGAQIGDATDDRAASQVCDEVVDTPGGAKLGTPQTVNGARVTVTEASWDPEVRDFFDGGFLSVDFTLRNTSDVDYEYGGASTWELLDLSTSAVTPEHFDATAALSPATVAPGEEIDGHITFRVGYTEGDYRVRFGDRWDTDAPSAYWAVRVSEHEGGTAPTPDAGFPGIAEGFENMRSYEIDVTIMSDGAAEFVETIKWDFSDSPHHGIYRDLIVRQRCNDRYDRVYPLEVHGVSSETAPDQYDVEDIVAPTNPLDGAATKRIKIGDPDRTITGVHTYEIRYRLDGVLNGHPDHDEFYWNVVGDQWGVQLADIHVVVHTPGEVGRIACFSGATGSRAPCTRNAIADGNGRFFQNVLMPYQGMSVVVAFPKGGVPEPEPILDERWSLLRAFTVTPATAGGAAGGSFAAIALFAVLAYRVGRDREAGASAVDQAFATEAEGGEAVGLFEDPTIPVEFAPPDDIRPAEYATLLAEDVEPRMVSATIIDLAVRGYLRIEEIGEGRKRSHILHRLDKADGKLLPFEKLLLTSLFALGPSVTLSSLHNNFASELNSVMDSVWADVMGKRWFAKHPDKVRAAWRALAVVGLLASIGLLVFLTIATHAALLAIPPLVFSILLLFAAGKMPRRTPVGTAMLRRSLGFEIFMRDSEAPRARWAENKNIFSEYLPYAIVLGIADRWATTFQGLGAEALGGATWYVGHHPMSVGDLTNSTSDFTRSAASVLRSSPASSGSSGFSSGGGSSGGGGGGGGGGSW